MDSANVRLETATDAARLAGGLIRENLGKLSPDDIGRKMASDFVTRVDRESEALIIGTIRKRFPDHDFLAEESAMDKTGAERWIIDPLDGTTNFIHGYPMFSVSIAFQKTYDTVMGVVYDPLRDELFTAEKDKGAFLNGKPIRVSSTSTTGDWLITTGFPFRRKELLDLYLEAFRRIFIKVSGIRRAGSAALDLAHLAAGRCDGFFEIGLSAWDIAAGDLLVREAGGLTSDFGGGQDYLLTGNLIAGNPHAHPVLLAETKTVFAGIINK